MGKKKTKIHPRLQLFMAEKGISMSEEELEEATKKLNEMLENFSYPEKEGVMLSSDKTKKLEKKEKD